MGMALESTAEAEPMRLRKMQLARGFVLTLAVSISAVFFYMIREYFVLMFLSAVAALLLHSTHEWLTEQLGGRRVVAVSIIVLGVVVALLVPAAFMLGMLIEQASRVGELIVPWLRAQLMAVEEYGPEALPYWIPYRVEVKHAMKRYVKQTSTQLGDLAEHATPLLVSSLRASTDSVGTMLMMSLDFCFFVYALACLLLTGRTAATYVLGLLPLSSTHRELLAERVYSTVRATVKGSFIIAIVQGGLTGCGLALAGVPLALFWAALATVCAIIPVVGPPLVWVPAALWLGTVAGRVGASVGLLVYGVLFVTPADNLLRPILVGQDAQMSDLMVLLSTLGGIGLFGAGGLICGPLIAALMSSVWCIYREVFDELLDEGPDGAAAGYIPLRSATLSV
jgi:predicted PurR-regulated permease PerM